MSHSDFDFQQRAREAMIADHFAPDFPPEAIKEAQNAQVSLPRVAAYSDLRALLWSSIDNTTSRDLDQIEWAEQLEGDWIRVRVGIADVSATVTPGSACDAHARQNATSVYTGGPVFAMLPERLSTDLTSLGPNVDRAAVIMEFVVDSEGVVVCADVYSALVRNRAQLNYDQVGRWLQGAAAGPCDGSVPADLCAQLRLQAQAAARLKKFRHEHGALTLGGVESVPIVVNNQVTGFDFQKENPARDIIESFMIAANVAMAQYLRKSNSLSIRRVVRTPKRWDRIQAIAQDLGTQLPAQPDPIALNNFLAQRRQNDPDHFPELSLAVLKAMGPGEYIVEHPGDEHVGHFGLAVDDYTHSTAPNRRYADLVMQRLLKACIARGPAPFSEDELSQIAAHCTEREAAARHVERFMKKVAAAILLSSQIGKTYRGIVTGNNDRGVFVRLVDAPAEGRVIRGEKGLDVGARVRVKLVGVDVKKGFIDLATM